MSTKRKGSSTDYAAWEKLANEIEDEEKSERSAIEKYWENKQLVGVHSKMLGQGGFLNNHENFEDACKLYWHHFKKHSIFNKSSTKNIEDKELEKVMQKWYNKAMVYYHLFEFQLKEGHLKAIEPVVVAAMLDQKEKFCKNANSIGNWIDQHQWKNEYPEEREKYLIQYNDLNKPRVHEFDLNK